VAQHNEDYADNPYASFGMIAERAPANERTAFIRSTYLHLGAAVLLFTAIEAVLLTVVPEATLQNIMRLMMGGYSWLLVLGAFMVVSWIADSWAQNATSRGMQYAGLGLYIVAESVLFLPLLYIASRPQFTSPDVLPSAAIVTLLIFGGLTAVMYFTKADLRSWGPYLAIAGMAALGFIVCSFFFNFEGMWTAFTCAMIALAAGYILYSTSNVMHHYRTDQDVAAALALFAAVALLFWYVLQLFMSRD